MCPTAEEEGGREGGVSSPPLAAAGEAATHLDRVIEAARAEERARLVEAQGDYLRRVAQQRVQRGAGLDVPELGAGGWRGGRRGVTSRRGGGEEEGKLHLLSMDPVATKDPWGSKLMHTISVLWPVPGGRGMTGVVRVRVGAPDPYPPRTLVRV